jgi:predicted peroxiredoxin
MIIPVTAGVTGIVRKEAEKMCKPQQKTLSSFTTKNSYTRNITHNTESAAV